MFCSEALHKRLTSLRDSRGAEVLFGKANCLSNPRNEVSSDGTKQIELYHTRPFLSPVSGISVAGPGKLVVVVVLGGCGK